MHAFRIIFMAVVFRLAVISSLLHECLINIIYTLLLQAIGLTGCVVVFVAAGAISAASLAWLVSAISRLHNVVNTDSSLLGLLLLLLSLCRAAT